MEEIMVQTCTKCSRANPVEAIYCYFDGFVLAGHERRGGPVAAGAKTFVNSFVFPSGRTCRSFNELALACQEEWSAACELLQQGYLEGFLGGIGRIDLALAAKEAARFPDRDRGLDQQLGKLPTDVLADPKLRLDPLEMSLGVLPVGEDRAFDLHLENQGMRLLYGSVTCANAVWLTLGDAGATEKHFQFTHDLTIPVHVHGDRLRASNKPLEARLVVESNGGTFSVVVRADVPVKPFPKGVLAGARSPRQVAEKCQAHPKDAAPLFESGEVEKWYESNGWTYPVKVPAASGLAAVQQFFEALGVTKPPKVDIDQRSVALNGDPGEHLRFSLEVSSKEKRPVFAHAVSNVPWLEVGRPKFNGRVATVNLSIPTVPNRPGETLTTQVTVQSNGNQRFVVPVTLEVRGSFNFDAPAPVPIVEEVVVLEESVKGPVPVATALPQPMPAALEMEAPVVQAPIARSRRSKNDANLLLHAVPALLLMLAVFGVVVADLVIGVKPVKDGDKGADADWRISTDGLKSTKPVIGVQFSSDNRIPGVTLLASADPENNLRGKLLTASPSGLTNNTIVKIGGAEYRYGNTIVTTNRWRKGVSRKKLDDPRHGWYSDFDFTAEQILVRQHVEIVPGQTGLLDTILVYYRVRNYGTIPHKVGLRIMLDTYIGSNDGVPFTVPGRSGFVDTMEDFDDDKVPDYIEAIENPTPEGEDKIKDADLGTTVRMGLRGITLPGVKLDEPKRLRICRYPGNPDVGWDWEPQPIKPKDEEKGDSCVAVYWEEKELGPDEVRHMALTYGLSKLEVGDALALSVPASVQPSREFVATAYVWNPKNGQKVTLTLPEGISFASGEKAEKVIEGVKEAGKGRTQVFWRLRPSGREGSYPLSATLGGQKATRTVRVKGSSIFG
jgi:hypothetical protein